MTEREPRFDDRVYVTELSSLAFALVVGGAIVLARNGWTLETLGDLLLGLLGVVLVAGVPLHFLKRGLPSRRVRVFADRLRVGRWEMPADRIGAVDRLSVSEARRTGAAFHHGDRRIHLSTANRLHNTLEGVAVEDLRHDPSRVWIVTTRRPDELLAVLEAIRRDARDRRTTR